MFKRSHHEKQKTFFSKSHSHLADPVTPMRQARSRQVYQEYVGSDLRDDDQQERYEEVPKQPLKPQTIMQKPPVPHKKLKAVLPKEGYKALTVGVLLLLAAIVAAYNMMPMHYVNGIAVEGAQASDPFAILEASGVQLWDPVGDVKFREKQITDAIMKANANVSQVELLWGAHNHLTVKVHEKSVVAKLWLNNRFVPVLVDGTKVLESDSIYQSVDLSLYPEIVLLNPDKANIVTKELSKTPEDILRRIEKIQYSQRETNEDAIEVWMRDGNIVKAILLTFNQKMAYYPKILEELAGRKGTVNLEVGAYFSPSQADVVPIKLQTHR